jgi:hypothetical protein
MEIDRHLNEAIDDLRVCCCALNNGVFRSQEITIAESAELIFPVAPSRRCRA